MRIGRLTGCFGIPVRSARTLFSYGNLLHLVEVVLSGLSSQRLDVVVSVSNFILWIDGLN